MSRRRIAILLLVVGIVVASATPRAATAQGAVSPPDSGGIPRTLAPQLAVLQEALQQELGVDARLATRRDSALLRFAGTSRLATPSVGQGLPRDNGPLTMQAAEAAGEAFLATYGPLFGLGTPGVGMRVERTRVVGDGRGVVRYQQEYLGVPVFGGQMVVQFESDGRLLSALADLSAEPAALVEPRIDAAEAQAAALRTVALREAIVPEALSASEPALWIYDPAVVGETGAVRLAWRTEVRSTGRPDVNSLVLIDAQTGGVALTFSQVATQLPTPQPQRAVYDGANDPLLPLPGVGPVRFEGGAPTDITDANLAYEYSGATFAFYVGLGRDSLDGLGMPLTATVRYCDPGYDCPVAKPYLNAFWNGEQTAFGAGFATDDVVAHEFTHGVIDHEARLFYFRQSGALSEGFGDAFGEFVDLQASTPGGLDDVANRWKIGEELPAAAAPPLRDMRDPTLLGDPDHMQSNLWACDAGLLDNGGIHTNSGVMNKAVYLMADGGTARGITVQGLGIPKVSRILYEALSNLLTSGSDYADLAVALVQAAASLRLTPGDIQQVRLAVDATGMALERTTACPAIEAPTCDGGVSATLLYADDLESPAAGKWLAGPHWYYPQSANPYNLQGLGWDMTNATSGTFNLWGDADFGNSGLYPTRSLQLPLTGTITMRSDVLLVPNAYLRFNHSYAFQHLKPYGTQLAHGGIVEYSTNGGLTWLDLGPLFTTNGYDGTLSASGNPLSGRMAFAGDSNGYISTRADLRSLANQTVRLRFTLGTDALNGSLGWFIDDIALYTCSPPLPPTVTPTPRARIALPLMMRGFAGAGVTTLLADDFEGTFPGRWTLVDNDPADARHTVWARRPCRAHSGQFSAWASGGGADGSLLACGAAYGNDVHAWMVAGPFSLSGAAQAALDLRVWVSSAPGDALSVMASDDGIHFFGDRLSGSTRGWAAHRLDLAAVPGKGSLLGRTAVWVAVAYDSDASTTLPDGAYVDDVHLWKSSGATILPLADDGAPTARSGLSITAGYRSLAR